MEDKIFKADTNQPLIIDDVGKAIEDYKKKLDLSNSWHREKIRGVVEFLSTVCKHY